MPPCVSSNSSKWVGSTPTSAMASRTAMAPRSNQYSSRVPASSQIARWLRRASADRATIRTGSHSSQRRQTSSRMRPVARSNGRWTVPSGSADQHAAITQVMCTMSSCVRLPAGRLRQSSQNLS
jgi:hypothetical protein